MINGLTDKSFGFIIGILIGIVIIAGLYTAFYTFYPESSPPPYRSTQDSGFHLITPTDLQEELVKLGYDIKVDGKMCQGWHIEGHSETLAAWDKAIGQQYALEFDYESTNYEDVNYWEIEK